MSLRWLGILPLVFTWIHLTSCVSTPLSASDQSVERVPPPAETEIGKQTGAAFSVMAWMDLNQNGIREEDEPPAQGIQVTFAPLRKDLRTSTAITDSSGWAYRFLAGAPCTAYRIELSLSPETSPTTPDVFHGSCTAQFGILPANSAIKSFPATHFPTSGIPQRTAVLTPTPLPPQEKPIARQTSTVDGMVQVFVAPGNFTMGSNVKDAEANEDEKPSQVVNLPPYWIDQTEISNRMFAFFVAQTGYLTEAEQKGSSLVWDARSNQLISAVGVNWRHPYYPSAGLEGLENHPVVHITWKDADVYCRWAGRRLPAEPEWEKAARGEDSRRYPWGNQPPSPALLNYSATTSLKPPFTIPVGSITVGKSPYQVYDLAGNVQEWTNGLYLPYGNPVPNSTPTPLRVVRGGSWLSPAAEVRTTARKGVPSTYSAQTTGFRCAANHEPR